MDSQGRIEFKIWDLIILIQNLLKVDTIVDQLPCSRYMLEIIVSISLGEYDLLKGKTCSFQGEVTSKDVLLRWFGWDISMILNLDDLPLDSYMLYYCVVEAKDHMFDTYVSMKFVTGPTRPSKGSSRKI